MTGATFGVISTLAIRLFAFTVLACTFIPAAHSALVVFGDSFSDDGRGASPVVQNALSSSEFDSGPFPAAPYFQGRFTNGRVWNEIVAASFGLELENYAVGNAISGVQGEAAGSWTVLPPYANLTSSRQVFVPFTLDQAESYLSSHHGVANAANTYIIFIGGNDYLNIINGTNNATVAGVVQAINQTMLNLYSGGARRVVIMNLPNLAGLPNLSPPFMPRNMTAVSVGLANNFTTAHNAALRNMTVAFNASMQGANVQYYNTQAFLTRTIANATALGFMSTNAPCLGGPSFLEDLVSGYNSPLCSNSNSYVFWDPVHLTKHTHALLAQDFMDNLPQLNQNSA